MTHKQPGKNHLFLFNYLPLIHHLEACSPDTCERWMERFQIMTCEGISNIEAFELIKKFMRGDGND